MILNQRCGFFVYLLMTTWPVSGPSPSKEQQKAWDEGFSDILIFNKRKEVLDGQETLISFRKTCQRFFIPIGNVL
ncbi:MAG: hypothetical protein NXY57DRAFT_981149 [Lentinula lateritia]|nr:MAG: hypothetical protein NXY57DRAFT_981149 [Lentinula lateritia]